MARRTLIHREVANRVHILNYSLGQIQSFRRKDGRSLLDHSDGLSASAPEVDPCVLRFLRTVRPRISSRVFRPALLELGMRYRFPAIVNIELTRRCLMRCRHCYIPHSDLASDTPGYLESSKPAVTAKLFDTLASLGVFLVVLTGGEVFISKHCRRIFEQLEQREFVIEVFSSLQSLPDWFLRISPARSRLGRVQTSVYSVDPAIHDGITRRVGSLRRTLDNLERLRDRGFEVEVATPLMRLNFSSRHELAHYFIRRNIRQSFAWPIVGRYYAPDSVPTRLNLTGEQFLVFCKEHPGFLIERAPSSHNHGSLCPAGCAIMALSATADVFPCSQFPKAVGNLKDVSIEEAYRSPAMKAMGSCSPTDLPDDDQLYNYCIGNNWSDTGSRFRQSPAIRRVLEYYRSKTKGGGKTRS